MNSTEVERDSNTRAGSPFVIRLTVAYTAALTLLAVLAWLEHAILQANISLQSKDALIVSTTERQRMLVQRVALCSLGLVSAKESPVRDRFREELRSLASQIEHSHAALLEGGEEMKLPRKMSDEVRAMYLSPPLSLDSGISGFVKHVRDMVAIPDEQLTFQHPKLDNIVSDSTQLLTAYEKVVGQLRSESEAGIARLQRLETLLLIVTVSMLGATAAFIFRPLVLRMNRELRQREEAERGLRESEAKYRLVTDNASDVIVTVDRAGTLRYANPAATEIFGFEPAELVGQPLSKLLDEAMPLIEAGDREAAIGASKHRLEATGRHLSGGRIDVELSIGKHGSGEDRVLILSIRDISDRKRAEAEARRFAEELEHYTQELERSNKELEQFAAIASHDLQEPLRSVASFTELLRKKLKDKLDDQTNGYMDAIGAGARRMKTLIDDLLNLSRITTSHAPFVKVDLNEVLAQVLADLATRIKERDATIERSDLPSIEADPSQMRQLLQNLVGNALKFCREGVKPIVKVTSRPVDTRRRGHSVCEITIQDNGIGFSKAHSEEIFEIFHRLHGRERYEGTGIGLAVCKRIVDRHGGTISADGKPGEGARFSILLPLRQPTRQGTKDAA